MAQVLWNGQNTTLPGRFFHSKQDITIPWHFNYIRHRMRLKAGKGQEIDMLAAAGGDIWICQSKWWMTHKVGIQELQDLERQGEAVSQNQEIITLTLWIFAYSGLTPDGEAYASERGILWSALPEFNELLDHVGLRHLPELSEVSERQMKIRSARQSLSEQSADARSYDRIPHATDLCRIYQGPATHLSLRST